MLPATVMSDCKDFVTMYTPDAGWLPGKPFEHQPHFEAQLAYWKARQAEGALVELAETVGTRAPSLLAAWRCESLAAARALAARSPLVVAGVARAETGPGTLGR